MTFDARSDAEALKRKAAEAAFELVRPGMRLGLGTGSTARHFVDDLTHPPDFTDNDSLSTSASSRPSAAW